MWAVTYFYICMSKKTFCRTEKHCQKVRTTDKPRKDKICDSGKEKQFKENKIGLLKVKKLQILKSRKF